MENRRTRARLALLAAVAATLLGTRPGVLAAAPETKKTCCFANPEYAGICEVEPADDETCASVLAYLNSPASTGKSYCSSTEIRRGWTQASCKPAKKAGS